MAKQIYTLSRAHNNYFNGRDLHVCKIETGEVISVNSKDNLLAVNVKDQATIHNEPAPVQEAVRKLGEAETHAIYDRWVESYWDWANGDLASEHGFPGVYSYGRSGGWLVVEGTETIEDDEITESPAADSPWGRFLALAFEAVAEIATYRDEWRNEMGDAAVRLNEAHNEVPRISAAGEPIKVLAHLWINAPTGKPNCALYRNKIALMAALGTEYEGAATTALAKPGALVLTDRGSFISYLTVVE